MCLAFFGLHPSTEDKSLVFFLAFNRDEFLARCVKESGREGSQKMPMLCSSDQFPSYRPSSDADWWPEHPDILAGRDMVGNGTWLGVSRSGRVAFLTNLREKDIDTIILKHQPHHRSRGALPVEFLSSSLSPVEFLKSIDDPQNAYLGFNLVLCDIKKGEIAYMNNSSVELEQGVKVLSAGSCYGLANGVLNEWRKVTTGIAEIEPILKEVTTEFPHEKILKALQDEEKDEALKHGPVKEHYLVSCRFIPMTNTGPQSGYYGTRSQTTFCIRRTPDGLLEAEMKERMLKSVTLDGETVPTDWTTREHKFLIS